ncbi:hypothetical protein LMG7974_01478 [Campylobacter majalis]|uniref:Uncharacterized protein n=1 Tax=Campylobacter majalis TaxID=2790656 RepID=A0ABN7KCB3_9BACT|nr:hypothetical protein [Campylobacter majalis]CAD7289360.1 hypothetical protein LMG7974_01478 [Campylobacter majalis]
MQEDIKKVLEIYGKYNKSRQRDALYEALNKVFGIDLAILDYADKSSDQARIALSDEKEVAYVVNAVAKKLQEK